MAVFPSTTVEYINPVRTDIQYKTLITNFDDEGEEQRKQKWTYPKRSIHLTFKNMSKSEAETLWQFYIDRAGSYEAFAFFESTGINDPYTYTQEYVGTGDSTTTVYNVPAVNSSASHTMYLDGISTTGYTMSYGGGSDGEDKATFDVAPNTSEVITYSFTGQLRLRCRFAEDKMTFDNFYDTLVNSGLRLQGLINA
jgi:hypothetical protein